MNLKDYEIEEAMQWLKQPGDGTEPFQPELLAQYGRRLYNQAINDAINTVNNNFDPTPVNITKHIKKLER